MQIIKYPINSIKGNPNNPRLIKDDKFVKLVKSIKEFPEMLELRPIVVNDDMVVLGGNMRLKACKEAGLKEVPIMKASTLTEEQQKEFIIKDNVGFGEWDWSTLANEWDSTKLEEWGMDLPDFTAWDETAEEDDYEIPDEIKTDIVLGDLFEIGEHRLLCGDSTMIDQVEKLMNGEKADMVFTDPPYGMFLDTDYSGMKNSFKYIWKSNSFEKVKWDWEDFNPEFVLLPLRVFSYCKEIFLWWADYYCEYISDIKNNWSWVVWDKSFSESENIDKMYWSNFELCWSKSRHKRELARIKWKGLFWMEKDDTKSRVHPTQKPAILAEWFFDKWGKDCRLIVDIFLWSWSTMVASQKTKRKCYGMELDPKYCQVIVDRMKKLDPALIIKRNWEIYNP